MVKVGDRKFTGVEFSSYVAKPGDPKPDFSEFKQLNKPKTEGKHFSFKVFKHAAAKLAKKKEAGHKDLPVLAIVTARPPDVVPHMRKWLKDNGVDNADDVHIHAVGSSDPRAKVEAIRSHITSGRVKHGDQIHFFDDHGPNVEAIHGMREDHPEINIRSVQVGPHRKKGK
jgi:hypothetical protein